MYCKKCGNEIKKGEKKCNKCGANVKNKMLPIIICICLIIIIGIIVAVILSKNSTNNVIGNAINNYSTQNKNEDKKIVNENSTAENDMDLGLKFTKIDNKSLNLTEEQKAVIEYFDYDYLDATHYEFLQRYPDIYRGTQIYTSGKVQKIISSDNDNYEILFWIGDSQAKYEYWQWRSGLDTDYNKYQEENKNNYVVIKGKQGDTRLIEGDFVSVRGRYVDIEDYTIDGTSYHIPTINTYRTLIGEYNVWDKNVEPYNAKEIRQIAKIIFGDITIREPREDEALIYSNNFLMNPWYICELDNQSNAKFGKYFFSRTVGQGKIIDSRSTEYPFKGQEDNIIRKIEFAPDFEHFYIFVYDTNLNFLTVEYYNKDLKKLWSREFDDTISATYDFTKHNVYLIANNTLYVINTSNGEDTYSPKFVGEKLGVRKLEDSLILFSTSQYDAIMKTDLKGEIIWKTNVDSRVMEVASPQVVDNNLIVNMTTENEGNKFYKVNLDDGKIILNAKSYQ